MVVDTSIKGLRQQIAELEQEHLPEEDLSSFHQLASIDSMAGERKFVTIMFADISGFTALSEKMDPEAVRDLMNACFDDLVPVIKHYGGEVDKFIGDEIMTIFGDGLPHERRLGKMYRIR